MPRLTNAHYLHQRKELRTAWFDHRARFGYLCSDQQFDLHRFFAPTKEWSDEQVIEHRQKITAVDPSLPQRAGRAWRAYEEVVEVQAAKRMSASARPVASIPRRQQRVVVRAVTNSEIDTAKLAQALIAMIRNDQARRTKREGK